MAGSGSVSEYLAASPTEIPSFQLTETAVKPRRVGKSVSSPRHKRPKPPTLTEASEPFYIHESHPARVHIPSSPIRFPLTRGKSLTPTRIKQIHVPNYELTSGLPVRKEDFTYKKTAEIDIVETERYRQSLMLRANHHLFRAVRREQAHENAQKSKVLRADVLFSRLLDGMRSLLTSNGPTQREIPPFMAIRTKASPTFCRQIFMPNWMRRGQKDKLEEEQHLEKILGVMFDALDLDQRGQIPGLNLIHFLHNFGYEIEINSFNEVLRAYMDTSLDGVIYRQKWMALMRNEDSGEIPPLVIYHKEELPKVNSPRSDLPTLPADPPTKALLAEIQIEVHKANKILRRFKLWWDHLSTLNRGCLSLKTTCVTLSAQYGIHYREVLQRTERLFGRDAQITEWRFLALLYPHLLVQTLRNLGEKMYEYWLLGSSLSFEAFVSAINRKAALVSFPPKS